MKNHIVNGLTIIVVSLFVSLISLKLIQSEKEVEAFNKSIVGKQEVYKAEKPLEVKTYGLFFDERRLGDIYEKYNFIVRLVSSPKEAEIIVFNMGKEEDINLEDFKKDYLFLNYDYPLFFLIKKDTNKIDAINELLIYQFYHRNSFPSFSGFKEAFENKDIIAFLTKNKIDFNESNLVDKNYLEKYPAFNRVEKKEVGFTIYFMSFIAFALFIIFIRGFRRFLLTGDATEEFIFSAVFLFVIYFFI